MKADEPIAEVAKELGIVLEKDRSSLSRELLAATINEWIQNDFQKLVTVLYRMDVSESKLKLLLKENPNSDAGLIIADLMIERQVQKIKSRQQFRQQDNNIDEEEKW